MTKEMLCSIYGSGTNGSLRHHGDCRTYQVKICTCGLLSAICFRNNPEDLYPEFYEEFAEQNTICDELFSRRNDGE